MKVGELIEALQEFDEDLEVQADAGMHEYEISSVDLADEDEDGEDPVVVLDLYHVS